MSETTKQAIVKIIGEMVSAVTNIHLYPPTHPQVAPLVDHLYDSVTIILETTPELAIVIVAGLSCSNGILSYSRRDLQSIFD